MQSDQDNAYCRLSDLNVESDVEQFFIAPLLADLGYTPSHIETKKTLTFEPIDKGRHRRDYVPDYIVHSSPNLDRPVLVIDAKRPEVNAHQGLEDAQLYAAIIRRRSPEPKPAPFCIGTNASEFLVTRFDDDEVIHHLRFGDFDRSSPKFRFLRKTLARKVLATNEVKPTVNYFRFRRISPDDLPSIFEMCHRKIWKTEKRGPASAFYEFSKLMYIKIDEDRRIRQYLVDNNLSSEIDNGKIPSSAVRFSSQWITDLEIAGTNNPINDVLFTNLIDKLEEQISLGEKKRIFDQGEGIDLTASTIKEIVKILENIDLGAVDEDLNGRMFQTFLTATMRGKALGQFFTPRRVVKFMVQLAELQVERDGIDTVLDACCGTGGFLIEAMAQMTELIHKNNALTDIERDALMSQLRKECLWGIDAGSEPKIARVARLNMLLHGDGGSRIYQADALDKQLRSEPDESVPRRLEIQELRDAITGVQTRRFSVVLTNPPFSMNYERKDPKEAEVLDYYELGMNSKNKRASLKSSVMFIERYHELLDTNGHLITVMDDSVLNTMSSKQFREFFTNKFIVKAVIGLPKNTFVNAEGSVSTSVLYMRKKTASLEQQADIYMAVCGNVGHNDSGKDRPELNQLPEILQEFKEFNRRGQLPATALGFIVNGEDIGRGNRTYRLDAMYFNPIYFATIDLLDQVAEERGWTICRIDDLLARDEPHPMTGGATPLGARYADSGPKFIRVQNVKPNRIEWSDETDVCIPSDVHCGELARSRLKPGDVIFTITGTCGNAATIPQGFGEANMNQHSVRMRVSSDVVDPEYLAVFLNSSMCRPQIDRAVTGSSRPALDYASIRELRVLLPPSIKEQKAIVDSVELGVQDVRRLEAQRALIETQIRDVFEHN